MFHHKLQVWLPYINMVHSNQEEWHICINNFILDTNNGLVEMFTTTMNLNNGVSLIPTSIYNISKFVLKLAS
jgi:hypothetical protein